MTKKIGLFLVSILILSPLTAPAAPLKAKNALLNSKLQQQFGNIPLYFIQNKGQVAPDIQYYEKGQGHTTYFTKDGVILHLSKSRSSRSMAQGAQSSEYQEQIRLFPLNANKNPEIISDGELAGRVNYFLGNQPEKWRANVPAYKSVVYQNVYPGIDIQFYGNNHQLEYDIIVQPDADPSEVLLAYEGVKGLKVAPNGALEILLQEGKLVQKKPYIYQEVQGKRVEVPGVFKIVNQTASDAEDTFTYRFEVASYDQSLPLVIDPIIDYSSYLGGASDDYGYHIAQDSTGNLYVTGNTSSTDFPVTGALQGSLAGGSDIFVAKINAAGSALVYATYFGGNNEDTAWGIDVDSSGNVFLTGETSSTDFPTVGPIQGINGGGTDVFVTKINAAGSVIDYSTYLGSTASDSGRDIAVDSSGNAYITGGTNSISYPTVNPIQATRSGSYDAFVSKINPSGSALIYSTYVGGESLDFANGIAVDNTNNVYLTGRTNSYFFPTVTPFQSAFALGLYDAFVAKINAAGSAYDYATYLGGAASDIGNDIAVDASGSAYIIGQTHSVNFPVSSSIQGKQASWDIFVTKLNVSGTALMYSSYLGGDGDDIGHRIDTDAAGNAHIVGETQSTDFPTVLATQSTGGGGKDAFVSVINDIGSSLAFSTYLGGADTDTGHGILVDSSGNIFVTGITSSNDFPINAALQSSNAGGVDAFMTKITNIVFDPDITVTDSVVPTNDLTLSFGNVTINTTADQSLTLRNNGSSDLIIGNLAQIDTVALPFSIISDNCSGQTLTVASSCIVDVRFSPTAEASYSDSFDIPSNDPDEGTLTFILNGTGAPLPTPDITVSDSVVPNNDLSLPFGSRTVGSTSDQRVTLTNDGSADLVIGTLAQIDTVSAPFIIMDDNCSGQSLTPAASCTFDIRFSPSSTVSYNDTFDIPSNDADESSVTFNLSGTGAPVPAPDITVTDSVVPNNDSIISFGNTTVNTFSNQSVTITNDGSADLVIGTLAQVDTLAAPFSIQSDNCSGQTLAPADNCTFGIRFSPTSASTSNDTFDIPSNDFGENPVVFSVDGTGVPAPTPDITVSDSIVPNDDLILPFGDVGVGTESIQIIMLTNDGNADLILGSIGVSNPVSAPFSIQNDTCSNQTLNPSGNCTLSIHFLPTDFVVSNNSFDIPSNDSDESSVTVNLSGTGVALVSDIIVVDSLAPIADLQLPFGDLATGQVSDETVTLSNSGNGTLSINQIAEFDLSGSVFSILNDLCSNQALAPSENCTFDVRFSPTAVTTYNDSFKIPSNDPDENPVFINVSGAGLQATVNNPPGKPELVFPANGQTGLSQDLNFEWKPVSDPDGDPVFYDLYVCDSPDPLSCTPQVVASLSNQSSGAVGEGFGFSFILIGIVYLGFDQRKRFPWKKLGPLAAILLLTGTMLVSCSSGGGGSLPAEIQPDNKTQTITGLAAGTTYYWTVVAKDDQGGTTQSDIWQFTTQ